MRKIVCIMVLYFVMLLAGCGNSSDPKENRIESNLETTLFTDIANPVAPTVNNAATLNTMPAETTIAETAAPTDAITMPTETSPTETTAPTDAVTMPTETAPTETTAPTDAATMPTEAAPIETTTPTDAATMPTETAPAETTVPAAPPAAQSPAAAAGFNAVYEDICRRLDTDSSDPGYTYVNSGIMEVVNPLCTKEERYSSITYALDDLNNDGNLEMIVLDAVDNSRFLAVFELQNGQPVMIHQGGYRARLYKLCDGALYYEGSDGAAYSRFGAYGQCWFTYPKSEAPMGIGFYYAADGSCNPDEAQEITAEEYRAKQAELSQKIMVFSVYYFG